MGNGAEASRAKENYVIWQVWLNWLSYLACIAVHRLINAFCIVFLYGKRDILSQHAKRGLRGVLLLGPRAQKELLHWFICGSLLMENGTF